jgi:Predicted GTPase
MFFRSHIELNATNSMVYIFNKISFVIDPYPVRMQNALLSILFSKHTNYFFSWN